MLLDANIFIEAQKRYYAFDISPGFWECLSYYYVLGNLKSIDRVKAEIEVGNDELKKWIQEKTQDGLFFSSIEQPIQDKFSDIMEWVNSQDFNPNAKADFANGADGWLIAFAKVRNLVVVTEEKLKPGIKRRVPIPNVCKQFDVPYMDTFAMLRNLGVQFSWTP